MSGVQIIGYQPVPRRLESMAPKWHTVGCPEVAAADEVATFTDPEAGSAGGRLYRIRLVEDRCSGRCRPGTSPHPASRKRRARRASRG